MKAKDNRTVTSSKFKGLYVKAKVKSHGHEFKAPIDGKKRWRIFEDVAWREKLACARDPALVTYIMVSD